jgi:hypothetical protein
LNLKFLSRTCRNIDRNFKFAAQTGSVRKNAGSDLLALGFGFFRRQRPFVAAALLQPPSAAAEMSAWHR